MPTLLARFYATMGVDSRSRSDRPHCWDWFSLILPLLAVSPLLYLQAIILWRKQHLQFFPLAFFVAAWFIRNEGTTLLALPKWRSNAAVILAIFGIACCYAAFGLYSSWLAHFALIVLTFAWCLGKFANLSVVRILGICGLLAVTLPPPYNGDRLVVQGLQSLSTSVSSRLMDVTQILHLRSGNVIDILSKSLFVEEACSGVDSQYALMAVAGTLLLVGRAGLLVSLITIVTVPLWAILGNLLRIYAIVIGIEYLGVDLSVGALHTVLGLMAFSMAAWAHWSSVQFLNYVFSFENECRPGASAHRFTKCAETEVLGGGCRIGDEMTYVKTEALAGESQPEDRLTYVWVGGECRIGDEMGGGECQLEDKLTYVCGGGGCRIEDKLTYVKTAGLGGERTISGWALVLPGLLLVVSPVAWVGVFATSFSDLGLPKLRPNVVSILPSKSDFPTSLTGGERVSFTTQERGREDLMGQHSRVWSFAIDESIQTASLDLPFRSWHELWMCYQLTGWTNLGHRLVSLNDNGGQLEWPYFEVRLENADGEFAVLHFSHFSENGEPFVYKQSDARAGYGDRSSRWILPALLTQIRELRTPEPVTFQVQLLSRTTEPASEEQVRHYRDVFLSFRESMREKSMLAFRKLMGK